VRPRFRVLLVEPDAQRGANLKQLIEVRLGAEVFLAAAAHDAIPALSAHVPDVLLASALLSPQEDLRLINHVKGLSTARDLAVLSIGPIVDFDVAPQTRHGGRGFFSRRSRPSASVDCEAVVARIEDALERSRMESHVPNIHLAKGNATEKPAAIAIAPAPAAGHATVSVTRRVRRQRAHRWTRAELPWLSSAMTSTGVELEVLNISRTGLLAQSASKFEPNSLADVRLYGAQTSVSIPVRFVRSEVAHVDSRGVRYALAAVFQKKLDLVPDRSGSAPRESATPRALADLLVAATCASAGVGTSDGPRTIFENGLRRLVTARDVRIVDRPETSAASDDAICFTIPTIDRSPAVLHVTFDEGHLPDRDQFALLKAAAAAAAVVLHHEGSSEGVAAARPKLLPPGIV
jgi:hypothetical protein